jgi:hypothetical protein
MARTPKEYRRLPGRGMDVDGNRLLAVSRSLCTAWMGKDHLLLVSRTGYTETYKRFYFCDIQAVIIRKTAASAFWNTVLAILAITLILFGIAVSDNIGKGFLFSFGGFFALLVLISLWRGATCVTHIKTAVQTEQLAAWHRMRAARKGMAILRPRLQEAQGGFLPAELKARLEEQILRQTQASAPGTT